MSMFGKRGIKAPSSSCAVASQSIPTERKPETARKFKLDKSKRSEVQAGAGIVLERGSKGDQIVVGLLKGGPAERSQSVRLGDVLHAIDRVPLDALPAREIAFLMQGHAGSLVNLTLKRLPRPELGRDAGETDALTDPSNGEIAQETTLEVRNT